MNDTPHHHHGAHTHGGRLHVHASVDHLAHEFGDSTRLLIRLDGALMEKLGYADDEVTRRLTLLRRRAAARCAAAG